MKKLIVISVILFLSACTPVNLMEKYALENFTSQEVQNPEAIVYVKNETIEDYTRNQSGLPLVFSKSYQFPVGICIAEALQKIYPNVKVVLFYSEPQINASKIPMIKINNYKVTISKGWGIESSVCMIESNVECINLKCIVPTIKTKQVATGILIDDPLIIADISTEKACMSIAKQIGFILKENKIPLTENKILQNKESPVFVY